MGSFDFMDFLCWVSMVSFVFFMGVPCWVSMGSFNFMDFLFWLSMV